jgi:hypothetical protein
VEKESQSNRAPDTHEKKARYRYSQMAAWPESHSRRRVVEHKEIGIG